MKILFQASFYLMLLSPDLMSEMWVYKKVRRQGNMEYLSYFQDLQNQHPIKIDFKTNEKRKTNPTGCLAFFFTLSFVNWVVVVIQIILYW